VIVVLKDSLAGAVADCADVRNKGLDAAVELFYLSSANRTSSFDTVVSCLGLGVDDDAVVQSRSRLFAVDELAHGIYLREGRNEPIRLEALRGTRHFSGLLKPQAMTCGVPLVFPSKLTCAPLLPTPKNP
jgi:hypothetical protein